MSDKNENDIFFDWIEAQRQDIMQLPQKFRATLLVSLLDTIAKCACPTQSNRERFVNLIDTYSGWSEKDRVSLPQLQYLLSREKQPCLQLQKEVSNKISSWPKGAILNSDKADPPSSVLDQCNHVRCKELIEKARYAQLLWILRNYAVHEFRTPGRSTPIFGDNSKPYYHGLLDIETRRHSWELYMPPTVISELVQNCAVQVKQFLTQNNQHVYDIFNMSSRWYT